jgi:hypothetical protein
MKKNMLFSAAALLAGSLIAASPSPETNSLTKTESSAAVDACLRDDITNATRILAGKTNYSWKVTIIVPESSRFRPGPTEGKTEKDGFTHVTLSFGDNQTEMVFKGDLAAVTSPDGGWQSLSELDASSGPGRFMAMMVRNFKLPTAQALDIVPGMKEIKKDGDLYTSDLTEDVAKTLLTFRPRGGGGDGPTVSDGKGSVKFWLNDGVLAKYETHLTGKISFNGNDREVDRTTTVEIKDVNSTKVDVPEGAMKKLSPEPAKTAATPEAKPAAAPTAK